jgi:hypothetical protein
MKTGMHVQRAAIRKPNRVSDGDWASRQAKPSEGPSYGLRRYAS